jgi:flagellar assembly protein FliH
MSKRKSGVRIIQGGGNESVRQWQPPDMAEDQELRRQGLSEAEAELETGESAAEIDAQDPSTASLPGITAAELDELQRQAHQEGFEQGRREGQEFGHGEAVEESRQAMRIRIEQFDRLLAGLDRPFEQLDDQVESEIVTLVISMVRQLMRREVKSDPRHIVGVVREALAVLPVNARHVRVMLNPEDAELIREVYSLSDAEQKWQVVEDPVIQRGGCKVLTETSQIDATLESRLNALIAPLLTGGREQDPTDDG